MERRRLIIVKNYQMGFNLSAFLLCVIIMIPNFIWAVVPAPQDILRADSVTGTIDLITSVCQVLMIGSLCFLGNIESQRIQTTPLMVATSVCCLVYYGCWLAYYLGSVGSLVILGLTLAPCLAFLFYAVDRKNRIAMILILMFTVGHLVYAIGNFIL